MSIKEYLTKHLNLREGEEIPFPIYVKKFRKDEIVTDFGSIERNGYFITKGVMQSNIEKDGELKIIDFVFSGNFICAYTSYLLDTPSEIQTMAVTDCEVEYFYRDDIEKSLPNSIFANQFVRHVTETFFIVKLKRENELLSLSAEERYQNLMKERPEIIREIPIYKIAKYLGIHPESLSRIRKNIIS